MWLFSQKSAIRKGAGEMWALLCERGRAYDEIWNTRSNQFEYPVGKGLLRKKEMMSCLWLGAVSKIENLSFYTGHGIQRVENTRNPPRVPAFFASCLLVLCEKSVNFSIFKQALERVHTKIASKAIAKKIKLHPICCTVYYTENKWGDF